MTSSGLPRDAGPDGARVVAMLRTLAELTSDEAGAQRVAWTGVWQKARAFLREQLQGLPVTVRTDAAGNQWVTDHNNNTVLVFSAAQLAMTGTNEQMPVVTITSSAFNGPLGLVFDKSGNLWVANNGGVPGANNSTSAVGTTIVEFSKASLPTVPTSGMLTPMLSPMITLTDDGKGSIQGPWELAFDASGNLWSSNSGTPFTLVEFSQSMLAASGMPTPMTTISPTTVGGTSSLNETNGLCFDNAGNLAATNATAPNGSVPFFKAPLKSGMIVPTTFFVGMTTTLNAPAGCNFGPLIM